MSYWDSHTRRVARNPNIGLMGVPRADMKRERALERLGADSKRRQARRMLRREERRRGDLANSYIWEFNSPDSYQKSGPERVADWDNALRASDRHVGSKPHYYTMETGPFLAKGHLESAYRVEQRRRKLWRKLFGGY